MKKIFTGLCAIAAMALSGCSQEEQFLTNEGTESFTGVMELSESRTTLGDNGKVVWSAEDAISIFKQSGYHQKYQVAEGGSVEATFNYANVSSEHGLNLSQNYAVYPYSANHTLTEAGVFTLDLNNLATQTHTEGSFENGKSVMTAQSSNTNLFFYNALSMIRFKLWSEVPGAYNIKSITLSSANKTLNGTATVNMADEKPIATFTEGEKTITLSCTDAVTLKNEGSIDADGTATGGHDFYMLVPAGVYNTKDLTIKIEGTDENGGGLVYEVQYPQEGELTLERSKFFTIYKEFAEETWTGSIETGWDGESTSAVEEQNNVYEITTPAELAWVASEVNNGNTFSGKTVKLMNNIDLSNKEWTPIGTNDNRFQGTFDGQEHTISNLFVSGSNNYVGLFGATTGGEIKNLKMNNATVAGAYYVAAVAGSAFTTPITNVTVTGDVKIDATGQDVAVVTGYTYGDITDVTVAVNEGSYVKASSYFGGVVGYPGEGETVFTRVKSNIDVIGKTYMIGGITGIAMYGNKFIDCSCSGDVSLTEGDASSDNRWKRIGGITGSWMDGDDTYVVILENCSYTGTLSSKKTDGTVATEFDNYNLVGRGYNYDGKGTLIINGLSVLANGLGKNGNTYEVSTANGLVALSEMTIAAGEVVKLTADIDLEGIEFAGLNAFNSGNPNTFDGGGHIVANLTMENSETSDYGFIRNWVGTIKNVTLKDAKIKGDGRIAIVAAKPYGNIENVHVVGGSIESDYWACGAISGLYNAGSMKDCSVTGVTVSSNGGTGGIVGVINETTGTRTFTNCDVKDCTINNAGIYGEAYGGGAVAGMINITNSTIIFDGCDITTTNLTNVYGGVEEETNTVEIK